MEVINNLARYRQKRGFSVIELAKKIEVCRQTIHCAEIGTYVPSTTIALRLARVLDVKVEDLFQIVDSAEKPAVVETAELIPSDIEAHPGLPVQVCPVDNRLVAMLPTPEVWGLPPADAVLLETGTHDGKAKIQIFNDEEKLFGKRLLIAGSDPGISVLLRHLQRKGVEAVAVCRNSTQALELLKQSLVHAAGSHLKDGETGEYNLPAIKQQFPQGTVAVMSYVFWETGMVTARDNPKGIKGIEDLARKDVTIVNHEPGSETRMMLDSRLNKLGVSARNVNGYETVAPGHLPAAWRVKTGAADCCLAVKTAACVFGLDFIMLERERYDLVIRESSMNHPGIKVLLDVLGRAAFRRELEGLGGYDAHIAGDRLI
jgi:molybdate-binding protein/DNA-binding XRE family transcriptional regulator